MHVHLNPHSTQIFLEKSKVQSCFYEHIRILIVLVLQLIFPQNKSGSENNTF